MRKVISEMTLDFKFSRRKYAQRLPSLQYMGIALVALLLFCCGPAGAASDKNVADPQLNVLEINSYESADIDLAAFIVELTGNVNITFGPTEITADKVVMYLKENADAGLSMTPETLKEVIASGNVEIVSEFGIADAREVVYDALAQTLVLFGEPAILKSEDWDLSCPVIRLTGVTL